jgi:hypothetical protein
MQEAEVQAYIAELRRVEERCFRAIMSDSDLYMLGVRLVRAVADSLAQIDDLSVLCEHLQRSSSDDVIPIAAALGAPQVVLLDYQLALGAAYALRVQEIQEQQGRVALGARLQAARASGSSWALLHDVTTRRYGQSLFQRLEMRLADGMALRYGGELDWERGLVYFSEQLWLDPETALPRSKVVEARREFGCAEELLAAVAALRQQNEG